MSIVTKISVSEKCPVICMPDGMMFMFLTSLNEALYSRSSSDALGIAVRDAYVWKHASDDEWNVGECELPSTYA